MRAADIMSSPVVTVAADTPVRAAAALLASHGFTGAPVVDGDGRLVGMITEADLARNRIIPDPRARLWRDREPAAATTPAGTVGDVMASPAIVRTPATDVAELATLMLHDRIRSVPIVEGDHLAGIVTRRDLLRALARDDESIEAEVRAALADYGEHPGVSVHDGRVSIVGDFTSDADRRAAEVVAGTVPGVQSVRIATRADQPS